MELKYKNYIVSGTQQEIASFIQYLDKSNPAVHVPVTTVDGEVVTRKPYRKNRACDFPGCNRIFKGQQSLSLHRHVHLPRTKEACPVCLGLYYAPRGLNHHITVNHPEYRATHPIVPAAFLLGQQESFNVEPIQ